MIRLLYLFFLVICMPLMLAGAEAALTDKDEGRLVVARTKTGVQYMVFLELDSSGKYYCTPLGSNKGNLFAPREVAVLPFHKNVPADTVSYYAIYYLSLAKPDLTYAGLAQYYAGQRNDMIRTMAAATQKQISELNSLNNSRIVAEAQLRRGSTTGGAMGSPIVIEEEMLNLIENGEPIQLILAAITAKDFFMAVGFYEYYSRELRILVSKAGGSRLPEVLNKYISVNQDELVKEYRQQRQAVTSVREQEFSKLCPDIFGAWKKSAPISYKELLQLYGQSFKSYLKLDNLSPNSDFAEWGSSMLDVLLLLPDSPVAGSLEKEFDQAFGRYKTRITK